MATNWLKRNLFGPVITFTGKQKEQKHFTKAPLFIGGCARSGTSLLLSVLSAHPKIFCFAKETDAFTEWEKKDGKPYPVRMDRMYRELLKAQVPKDAHRWCEKRPYNIHHIAEILQYFGTEVQFIHIVRDPRAVCTSVHPEKPAQYWVDPERYVQDVKSGLAFKGHPQVFTLHYEDLITKYEPIVRQLCSFLDETPHDHILNWYDYATVRTNRAWFTNLKDLQTNSLEKWKAPEHADRVREVIENEEIRGLMKELGYE